MAGWISSKLKVAETFLQQIDQQAAESLGKNEKPRSESFPHEIPSVTGSVSLKSQLKKKTPERSRSNVGLEGLHKGKKFDTGVIPSPELADGDWTELLSSPTAISPTDRPNGISSLRINKDLKKDGFTTSNYSRNHRKNSAVSKSTHRGGSVSEKKVTAEVHYSNQKAHGEESSSFGAPDLPERKSKEDNTQLGNGDSLSLEGKEDTVGNVASESKTDQETYHEKSDAIPHELISQNEEKLLGTADDIIALRRGGEGDTGVTTNGAEQNAESKISSGSDVGSDSELDSASTSDSENEKEKREERRRRRERVLAEEKAAKAAEAIKERENIVARLEGEKQSLERILNEREKQQAQEASELQSNMIETMEAVELEKQKHNTTRMEALTCLAKLEITNAELARSLAGTQWNLEVEVNRVAELRGQIELKEVTHEELRRRMSNFYQSVSSSSQFEASKEVKFEREILEAEYSFTCDKIAQLQEKAKLLEGSIVMTRKEMDNPTQVEAEQKRKLAQLTDHLIQKQAQVEDLASEKATLLFRLEMVTRLLDEQKSSSHLTDLAGPLGRDDIEAGTLAPLNSKLRPLLQDKIRSGGRQLGSIVRQLDSIFSAGALFVRRNPKAQLLSLVYLIFLHFWVLYILMSHSQASVPTGSGAVISLESINKTINA